mmetsp:Transcript_32237/g.96244  ORF Transcript_32237/g.96244 Transcript_32237/m.96244 type:complete len:135 (-) Transcript_32237:1171-1575(-)
MKLFVQATGKEDAGQQNLGSKGMCPSAPAGHRTLPLGIAACGCQSVSRPEQEWSCSTVVLVAYVVQLVASLAACTDCATATVGAALPNLVLAYRVCLVVRLVVACQANQVAVLARLWACLALHKEPSGTEAAGR